MYSLTLALFVSSIIFRTYAEIRHNFNPPHYLTGLFMIIMWLSWFALNDEDPFKYTAHPFLKITGIALLALGTIVFATGVITVIKGLVKKKLVSSFIFGKIRHPMYYGMILWLLGYPLFTSSTTGLFSAPAGIACILIWRHTEEKNCLENIEGYTAYMKKTWF